MFLQDLNIKFGPVAVAAAIREEKYIDNVARRYRVKSDEYYLGEDFLKRLQEMQQQMAQAEGGGQ